MKKTMAWTILRPDDGEPGAFVFWTRDEAIRHECWNLHEAEVDDSYDRSLRPWMHLDSGDVSKAWRRLKRKYGCRAVRVLIEVHPKYLKDTP